MVLDASQDPFGWSSSDPGTAKEESTNGRCSMEDLDELAGAIRQKCQAAGAATARLPDEPSDQSSAGRFAPVVVQSLTPLLHRHGFDRTARFLRRLGACCPVLVVFVAAESLSPPQHLRLERMASALLSIESGGAVLVRRGIRERSNVVRESLYLDFSLRGGRQRVQVRRAGGDAGVAISAAAATPPPSGTQPEPPPRNASGGASQQPHRRVQLSVSAEDDDAPRHRPLSSAAGVPSTAAASGRSPSADTPDQQQRQPRIIIQDDDPEFDDYDEEDPDDDLDL
jgi:hypothetical protein